MVQCIVLSVLEAEKKILISLAENINSEGQNIQMRLVTNEDYWKEKGYKKIIYYLSYEEKDLLVKDFITLFPIDWLYLEDIVTDVNTNALIKEESAIWSKNVSPSEIFLLPEIT